MKRILPAYVVPCMMVLIWVSLPLLRGTDTLFLRDVFNTHLGKKWVQAEALRSGELPVVDGLRDGGQPHLGNPNALPLFPDNLLFLVAPTFWAFNAHFWIHLLLAPLTMFWLARAWGFGYRAAWAAGVCYVASGFFLSNLGFYNLIAGAAWTPALVASALQAARPGASRRRLLPLGLIWTLLLLAGDPMTCLSALFLAVTAVIFRHGIRQVHWIPLGLALGLGSLIAAPQWVEFLRILPLSYRGHMGFSEAGATAASWHPLGVIEWFVPFFFGQPDLAFWGQSYHGGDLPLFPSLYPGLLALVLVLGSGWPRKAAVRWAWMVAAVGIFLALGHHNPLVRLLLKLPGTDLLRLPVKFWLLTAVGMAVVCAAGFERLSSAEGRRALRRVVVGLAVAFVVFWWWLGGAGGGSPSSLASRLTGSLAAEAVVQLQTVWAGWALISLGVLGITALVLLLARRSPTLAGATLLVLHLALQLWILRPLYPLASVAEFRRPPPLLEAIGSRAVITHGKANGLFGATSLTATDYPDARPVWLQRQVFAELYPVAGAIHGQRYDFSISAEGLDAFLTRAAAEALRVLPDEKRLRLLAVAGVDTLLLGRPLEQDGEPLAELVHRQPGMAGEILVYRIDAAPPVLMAGRVMRAPHLNAALEWITSPDFDPRTTVVLPAGGAMLEGPPGEAEILRETSQRLELRVRSESAGVVVVQRAFLPIYRAASDGERLPIVAANIHRLGVEVPAGEHRIEIWIDRRPLWIAAAVALLSLVSLVVYSLYRRPGGDC